MIFLFLFRLGFTSFWYTRVLLYPFSCSVCCEIGYCNLKNQRLRLWVYIISTISERIRVTGPKLTKIQSDPHDSDITSWIC